MERDRVLPGLGMHLLDRMTAIRLAAQTVWFRVGRPGLEAIPNRLQPFACPWNDFLPPDLIFQIHESVEHSTASIPLFPFNSPESGRYIAASEYREVQQ